MLQITMIPEIIVMAEMVKMPADTMEIMQVMEMVDSSRMISTVMII